MMFEDICKSIRRDVAKMMHKSYSSHIGGCYSVTEILVTLYFEVLNIDPKNPRKDDRDILLLSKAHSSPALYAILSKKGFFPKENLDTYYQDGGKLPGHLDKTSVPGIEFSIGALGHGFSIAIGMALANQRRSNNGKVFVLLGDGECNEGTIWEGAMLAAHLKLDNLTAIIDYNKIQSFGRTNEVINQEPIADKWKAFGWDVIEIDGHNFENIIESFQSSHKKPKIIIAHTVKGKGISFMEDKLEWHYKSPNEYQYKQALDELG